MLVSAMVRSPVDGAGAVRFAMPNVHDIGTMALALLHTMALMSLRLWELLGVALLLVVTFAVQVTMIGSSHTPSASGNWAGGP
jgi:ESS family glutamate:Na+ symporter